MTGKEDVFPIELREGGRRGTRTHYDRKTTQKTWGENNISSAPYLMGRQPELKLNKHLGIDIFRPSFIL
jgi:hypothetical protein